MDYDDQLPCGGYYEEDEKIKKQVAQISTSNQLKQVYKCQQCICINKLEINSAKEQQKLLNNPLKNPCRKCKINESKLLHKSQKICQKCLVSNIEYKCRLTLQNEIKINHQNSILICFSGGLNSICLLHLIQSLKNKYQKHPLFHQIYCVYIQQQSSIPQNYINHFKSIIGLNLQIIPIENILKQKPNDKVNLQQIKQLLNCFKNAANSNDIINIIKDRLLLEYAQKNKIEIIIKGTNGQKLACDVFKYFVKGIGNNISELCQGQKIKFHYPLRQHLQRQLQYYYYYYNLKQLALIAKQDDLMHWGNSNNNSNNNNNSLDLIVNNFITNLQSISTHTAPAILRTSQKIYSNINFNKKCKWCLLPIKQQQQEQQQLCRKCLRIKQYATCQFNNVKKPKWME